MADEADGAADSTAGGAGRGMRTRLTDISSQAWEHPSDAAALNSLRQVPGFDAVMRKVFGLIAERTLRMMVMGAAVEVGSSQYNRINVIYEEVLWALDAPHRYPLYISQSPPISAGAAGMEQPFIVMNAITVSLMDDDQLRYALGREVGHILSEHVLYKTMLQLMVRLSRLAFVNVFSGMAYTAVMAALMEWDRKSELSSDRAGLLAMQDPHAVRLAILRAASGLREGVSLDEFREQARRYEEDASTLDSIARALALLNQRQNFPVQRLKELDRWIASGDYQRILDGDYPRRSETPTGRPWQIWRGSAEGLRSSPLGRLFRRLQPSSPSAPSAPPPMPAASWEGEEE